GLLPPPLGPISLGVAHAICALPLGLLVARVLAHPRIPVALWPLAGLTLAIFAPLVVPVGTTWLDDAGVGPLAPDLTSSLLALGLVAPWLTWAVRQRGRARTGSSASWLIAAVVAVLPPMAYADQLRVGRSGEAKALLEAGRLTRTLGLVDLL